MCDFYTCPVCGHEFQYGDQCEHMYFDSMTGRTDPILKQEYATHDELSWLEEV